MAISSIPAIKGYELIEPIGEGAYGIVYRARQPFVDREVAVKVILPEFANQLQFIRRFETEAQLVAQLEHLHIVPLYDYWRDPEGAFLVMRLMKGGNLAEQLLGGPLDLPEIVKLVDQIASALHAAHQKGVVHRDLKPANILFDQSGNAYLSDFGIAKTIGEGVGLTTTGAILGTPAYISPEQVQSLPLTPQSDIYSLGILLFELLTGQHPFPDTPTGTLLLKHVQEPLPLVHQVRPEVPHEVDQIIQRATAKNPTSRYPDALILAKELRRALNLEQTLPEVITGELVNPYKGLRAFQESDADDFFGRQHLIQQLLQRFGEEAEYSRFLAVVGPSGSGKSSVVKAGLIPALRKGALPGSDQWFITEMVPNAHPFEELEITLLRVASNPMVNIAEQLQRDDRGVIRASRLLLPSDSSQLCLVIDQFEELFTLTQDEEIQNHFMESIYQAIIDPASIVRVIITLRADFYDRPLRHLNFSRLVEVGTALVLPLAPEELELAIRSPAERVGGLFEKGVIPAIIGDIINQPGALPLLQYTLTELFEHHEGRMLTCAAYQSIGGVLGALGRRAEEVYSYLDAEAQDTTRQLFLRLVSLGQEGEDTRRRVLQAEVEALQTSPLSEVINAYDQARLLTFDRDPTTRSPTIEVAHEALLKEWPRLGIWLDENRADVRMQRILANAAEEWLNSDKEPSFLLRGSRLSHYEGWVETNAVALTNIEKSFLEASIAARKVREIEEKRRRERELKQVSIGLAAQALQELEGPSPERSVLLSLEAIENYPYTWQAERALGKAVLENRLCMILEHDDEIKSANWSLKGDKILTSGDDGTIRLWNSKSGQEIMLLDEGDPCLASWSPDNKSILAITKTDEVQIWDVDTGLIRFTLTEEDIGGVYEILVNDWLPWSNSSKKFLTATNEGVVSIWDALSGHQLQSFHCHNSGKTLQAMWSPNDQLIASSSMLDGIVNILNIDKGKVTQTFYTDFEDERAIIAGWSPDGLRLAVRGLGGVKIYEVASGKQTMELTTSGVWNFRAIWSPSGDQILTSGLDDGTARIWNTESGEEINRLTGLDQARASAWSPDGSFVVVAGDDALIHLWDPHKDRELKRLSGTPMIIFLMAFSPNGNRFLAVGGRDNHLQVYKLSEASPQFSLPTPTGNFSHISWSSNGRQIALISYENKQPNIWDSETGEKVMTLNGHGDIAGMIGWSPSGDKILTTCEDGIARIWDGNTGEELLSFRGHQSAVGTGSWSPDGSAIVSGEQKGIIIIWDSSTGREILTFREHDSDIWQALWSPDGNRILSTDNNGQSYIWEASTGDVVFKFFPDDHQLAILAATWTKDGQRVILQSIDRTVHIFNTSSGEKIQQHTASGYGHKLSTSPSDERILIGCLDGTARVLDTSSGEELLVYDVGGGFVQAAYSPDGKRILIGTYAGDVMIFPTWHSTEELIDYAKEYKVFRQLTAEEREIYGLPPL